MHVVNILRAYPDEGERASQPAEVMIESHWNYNDRVCVVIPQSGPKPLTVTLLRGDIERAVRNACNHKA